MESFGGTKPYLSDFEIADDLAPDPFSEEPIKTMRHAGRESLRAENLKQRKEAGNNRFPRSRRMQSPWGTDRPRIEWESRSCMYKFTGFTEKANTALNIAVETAEDLGHTYIGSEHL